MSDTLYTRVQELATLVPTPSQPGSFINRPWYRPDGSLVTDFEGWVNAWVDAGYGWNFQFGLATTPITFAGAYDADAPDAYIYLPAGYMLIPTNIQVTFEAVGTESTMEIMALASPLGDSSATGTAATVAPMRTGGGGNLSGLTATGAIDAAGITDPNVTGAYTFWRKQRPLTDTVATGENDRHELNWEWNYKVNGPAPRIYGTTANGGSLAVYAASQAGTGFIIVQGLVFPPALAAIMWGNPAAS